MYSSHEAHKAQGSMVGMSDFALESCIGAPDQKAQVGKSHLTSKMHITLRIASHLGFLVGRSDAGFQSEVRHAHHRTLRLMGLMRRIHRTPATQRQHHQASNNPIHDVTKFSPAASYR